MAEVRLALEHFYMLNSFAGATLSHQGNPYTRLTCVLLRPQENPTTTHVELRSPILPSSLLVKLQTLTQNKVHEFDKRLLISSKQTSYPSPPASIKEEGEGSVESEEMTMEWEHQVVKPLLENLQEVLGGNKLLAAWQEIQDIRLDVLGPDVEMKCKERTGTVTFTFQSTRREPQDDNTKTSSPSPTPFRLMFSVRIKSDYPESDPEVKISETDTATNFPQAVVQVFENRLAALFRRCRKAVVAGTPFPTRAFASSAAAASSSQETPLAAGSGSSSVSSAQTGSSSGNSFFAPPSIKDLLEVRRDVQVLKQMADLKVRANTEKDIRRMKVRLEKSEWAREETLAGSRDPSAEGGDASNGVDVHSHQLPPRPPFLFLAADMLINGLGRCMVDEKCGFCEKWILKNPSPSASPSVSSDSEADFEVLPCLHFYHTDCFDKYICDPPFGAGKTCLAKDCKKDIVHAGKYSAKHVQTLRKNWDNKIRMEQELKEINDLFA
ncbi:hypothetical protein HK102_004316 [Quaeritorhiza haematococci]|nr:hypothetical protein HK102_004316 [Quaeritorhiza haematococci]